MLSAKSLQSCLTPQTAARQAPLSMGFFRQKYWSVLPFPSPGDLPNSRIKPASLLSTSMAGGFFTASATWEAREYGSGGGLVAKSCLTLATSWTVACQASLSMGFSRQEYWSGLP